MSDAPEFTREGYEVLLDGFVERGYQARSYAAACASEADLILRHDIDQSLDAALPIAEIESSRGWSATYFVLLQTEMYNPFSSSSEAALHRLLELGHDIGLHIDASLHDADHGALESAATRECAILALILDRPVTMISFHRPSETLLGLDRPIAGREHTYLPRYFQTIGYCSDSRGQWGHGSPFDQPAVVGRRALQLLTHPIWWRGPAAMDPKQKLDRLVEERASVLRVELDTNTDFYRREKG